MTALTVALAALAVAGWAGWRTHRFRRDLHDAVWADDTITWLRSIRDDSFDEHCAAALYTVGDELERRRIEQTMNRHPAGGQR